MIDQRPIYLQVVDNIAKKITSGELAIGERLPSERILAETFGINRGTIRKAIKHLETEGCVKTVVGSGTYIVRLPQHGAKLPLGYQEPISLSVHVRQQGMNFERVVLSFKKYENRGMMKDVFPNSAYYYELIRLSSINGEPYNLQKMTFPCDIFKGAERYDFADGSVYAYMSDNGHRVDRVISYLKVEKVPEEYASVLELASNKYLFVFDYYGFDEQHALVEYTISYNRPDYTSFKYVARR